MRILLDMNNALKIYTNREYYSSYKHLCYTNGAYTAASLIVCPNKKNYAGSMENLECVDG